jgi:hypothetical protein
MSTFSNLLVHGILIIASFLSICVNDSYSQVSVKGHYRKGRYVRPHQRTLPDGNPYNNYSFPGNYNPNTGRITPGNPETYLRNYYNKTNTGDEVQVHGYERKDGTNVSPYVRTKPDGDPYNNYSAPGNLNPNTGQITPDNPETYLQNYSDQRAEYITIVQLSLQRAGYDLALLTEYTEPTREPRLADFKTQLEFQLTAN